MALSARGRLTTEHPQPERQALVDRRSGADRQRHAVLPTRPLYIYFRHADINSTTIFQPGGTLNWVRTMLYNPGGATPYWCSAAGKADISASGIIPACAYTAAVRDPTCQPATGSAGK